MPSFCSSPPLREEEGLGSGGRSCLQLQAIWQEFIFIILYIFILLFIQRGPWRHTLLFSLIHVILVTILWDRLSERKWLAQEHPADFQGRVQIWTWISQILVQHPHHYTRLTLLYLCCGCCTRLGLPAWYNAIGSKHPFSPGEADHKPSWYSG